MTKDKKVEILKILDLEISKAKENAVKTDEASKFKISGPSQSGDKYHSEVAAELTNKYLQKLTLLRKEIEEAHEQIAQIVAPPCFLTIQYTDGDIMELVLVNNVVSITGISLISASSPLGKSVLGKGSGSTFSYSLETDKNYDGKILSVE